MPVPEITLSSGYRASSLMSESCFRNETGRRTRTDGRRKNCEDRIGARLHRGALQQASAMTTVMNVNSSASRGRAGRLRRHPILAKRGSEVPVFRVGADAVARLRAPHLIAQLLVYISRRWRRTRGPLVPGDAETGDGNERCKFSSGSIQLLSRRTRGIGVRRAPAVAERSRARMYRSATITAYGSRAKASEATRVQGPGGSLCSATVSRPEYFTPDGTALIQPRVEFRRVPT